MDPVEKLTSVDAEMVFNHLNAKEVMLCTLVSQKWNNLIESSLKCMEKFKLELGSVKTMLVDPKEIIESPRKFSNILISNGTNKIEFYHNVMKTKSHWYSVKIYCTKFTTTSELVRLFSTFEPTVKHLILVEVKNLENTEIELQIKMLKSLSLTYTNMKLTLNLLDNCSYLESLTLGGYDHSVDLSNVAKSLIKMKNLKKLVLSSQWFVIIFGKDALDFDFYLDDLAVTNNVFFKTSEIVEEAEKIFLAFLKTQVKSIKKLHLGGIFGADIIQFAFQMTELEEFTASHLSKFHWLLDDFRLNSSIRTLDIETTDIRNKDFVKAALISVPNITVLRMRSIDEELAMFIAENLKHLKTISLIYFHEKKINKILPHIEWQ